jgi:protein-tyrosine phosphatase
MDRSNYSNIITLARTPEDIAKVKLILNELPNSNLKDVPDPYHGGENGFENVYQMLDLACEHIAKKITSIKN